MRRALLTLGGTVAGIAALLAVKFQPAASSTPLAGSQSLVAPSAVAPSAGTSAAGKSAGTGKPAATGKPTATGKPAATGKPSASSKPGSGSSGGSSTGGSTKSSPAAQPAQPPAPRTVTGAVANTQYGPMQVAITVSGTKITKVTVLQETNAGGPSGSIDAMAIPTLTSEALSAQSAHINAVSGASYTSAGYIQSLQSAIDQAGL